MLQASPDDREALEGLRALGPEATAGLTRQVQDDVAQILAAGQGRKRSGRILQMGRLAAAAALVAAFGGAWWLLARLQQPDDHRQAFERHFEPLQLQEASDAQAPNEPLKTEDTVIDSGEEPQRPGISQTKPQASAPVPVQADLSDQDLAEDPYLDWSEDSEGWALSGSSVPPPDAPGEDAEFFSRTPTAAQNTQDLAAPGEAGSGALPPGEYLATDNYSGTLSLENEVRMREVPKAATRNLNRGARREAPAASDAMDQEMAPVRSSAAESESLAGAPAVAAAEEAPRGTRAYKPAPDPYEQGRKAYEAGDYRLATEWLVMVPADHPRGAESSLLQANAWLKRGKPERAEPLLENLMLAGEGPLYDQTRWYLALTRIAMGRPEAARPLLRDLQSAAPPLGERAAELLQEIGP
jgi:tetratricopeptide (TPR) repeat protein